MKTIKVLMVATVVVLCVMTTSCDSVSSVKLNSALDSMSYSIGVSAGAGYKQNMNTIPGEKPNVDLLMAGFDKAIKGEDTKISHEDAQAFLQVYFNELHARETAKTVEAGVEFLALNRSKDGVITTDSGLQYKVITLGKGAKPTADQKVKVHYTGTLLDGKVFDSSVERGEPEEFPVSGVIPGWVEGLQLMPVGSKYIFWIPSGLAYGERGTGANIAPNSMLTFEVELLDIVK